jgi:ubiquitin-activating enzyme E1
MSEFRFKFHDQIISIKDHMAKGREEAREPEARDGSEEAEDGEINKRLLDPNNETLDDIIDRAPTNVQGCIKNAVLLFVKLFHTSIKNLLTAFPPDYKTKEGQPFWMPPKRAPNTISFNVDDDLHLLFVQSASNILSHSFGVSKRVGRQEVVDFVKNEMLIEEHSTDHSVKTAECNEGVLSPELLSPVEFEKDNDTNFHIDFVYAAANLRAINYGIKTADRLAVKGIAGRIIPAIATTTAVVSGLAVLEMIKYALGVDHARHKNSFLNLALPFFATIDPMEPAKQAYKIENKKYTFTMWNRLEYRNAKLRTILRAFEIQFKKKITMVTIKNTLVYWDFDSKYAANLDKDVSELIDRGPDELFIVLDALTDDDDDVFPRIVVVFE